MKKYIVPSFRVVDMTADDNLMVTESFTDDVADAKAFKDDDLWSEEEVTSEGAQKSNLWDKEW